MKTKNVISVDDTGRGQCRIPAGRQLYYWDDQDREGWTPVATNAAYGTASTRSTSPQCRPLHCV